MDAEGRLGEQAEDTIRYFTNRLMADQVKRYIFRRYWTRRIVVGVLSYITGDVADAACAGSAGEALPPALADR